jgi:hypothetical protein
MARLTLGVCFSYLVVAIELWAYALVPSLPKDVSVLDWNLCSARGQRIADVVYEHSLGNQHWRLSFRVPSFSIFPSVAPTGKPPAPQLRRNILRTRLRSGTHFR